MAKEKSEAPKAPTDEINVMIGMPCSSRHVDIGAARSLFRTYARPESGMRVATAWAMGGVTHNSLWATALNSRQHGLTHIAIIHSDVEAEYWWLEKLMEIMKRTGADVVATVNALKTTDGLSSTGLLDLDNPQWGVRRFALKEIHKMPPSFCKEDIAPGENKCLCFSNGLWLADIRKSWVESVNFMCNGRLVKLPNGEFTAQLESEDWLVSQELHRAGAKVYATREVATNHFGWIGFSNAPWGNWETDEDYGRAMAAIKRDSPLVPPSMRGALPTTDDGAPPTAEVTETQSAVA